MTPFKLDFSTTLELKLIAPVVLVPKVKLWPVPTRLLFWRVKLALSSRMPLALLIRAHILPSGIATADKVLAAPLGLCQTP
jgi:hypothetical protein